MPILTPIERKVEAKFRGQKKQVSLFVILFDSPNDRSIRQITRDRMPVLTSIVTLKEIRTEVPNLVCIGDGKERLGIMPEMSLPAL